MLNYVNRLLIGKASGAANTGTSLSTLKKGDLLLIDANTSAVISTNSDAAKAKAIRVVNGVAGDFPVLSAPIVKSTITKFTEQAYAAAVAQVDTIADAKLVAGKEFQLTIVFKDDQRLIANRQTRRVIFHSVPAGASIPAELTKIVDKVNNDRVLKYLVTAASDGVDGLTLTGKAIPTKSINDYQYVNFTSSILNVTDDTVVDAVTTTKPKPGTGLPVQVRAAERFALGYLGFTDLRDFRTNKDVPFMASDDVAGGGYDYIHLLHEDIHTGDLQQKMSSPLQTTIVVATGSTQGNTIKGLIQSFVSGVAEDLTAATPVDAPAGE